MKTFIHSIITIVLTIILMMAATLLLDLKFVQEQGIRQIIVYLIIGILAFIGLRILITLNSQSPL